MRTEPERPRAEQSRQLLDVAIEARMAYADYLRAVADGERPADPAEKERLKSLCDEAHAAWNEHHRAWHEPAPPAGRH